MRLSCKTYCLLLALSIGLGIHAESIEALCGTWIELRATPMEDWHFDHWSDGDTSAVRQVEVLGDAHYIAYFAANCGDYANLPVVSLYDWLLMVDVKAVQAMGYYFGERDVGWYRVRGEPDKLDGSNGYDDAFVCHGYYLTLDKSLVGTGDYYAIIDVSSSPSGLLCTDYMRTVIVSYTSSGAPGRASPYLTPNTVRVGEQLTLANLNPATTVEVTVYDLSGHVVTQQTTHGAERIAIEAARAAGCYLMIVQTPEGQQAFRYIVH